MQAGYTLINVKNHKRYCKMFDVYRKNNLLSTLSLVGQANIDRQQTNAVAIIKF